MADRATQLEAFKAAASNCRSQLNTAATKDEALTLAISAADNLLKALKLSSSSDEKKQIKAQCAEIMNVADRIKKTEKWTPAAKPQPASSRNEQIGQWAAQVAVAADPSGALEEATTQSSSSRYNPSSTLAPNDNIQATPGKSSSSSSSSVSRFVRRATTFSTRSSVKEAAHKSPILLIDLSDDAPSVDRTNAVADTSHEDSPNTKTGNTSHAEDVSDRDVKSSPQLLLSKPSKLALSPATAPHSQIHRLREPVSTRKLPARESIILLKASTVNGFKFPPWDKNPSADEFALRDGVNHYTEGRDLSLSTYQQQFFQGWLPAKEAVPPPSQFPDRTRIGPLMSSTRPLDLVQDAASDCSVVTSLCAAIARAERGHDQMLTNKLYPYDKQLGKPVPSPNGKYVVRLNFNGCWRKVVIDDRLPVSNTHRLLHVTDRRNPALLWPALLEKAYLKVRGGYDFPGSNSCGDLWAMTGWIPEQAFLQEADTVPDQLWKRIYNAFMYGDVLVTAGTGKMSTRQERELGLEGQHSYVVLDMRETDQDRLLLVKNPWVEGKGWRGPRPSAVAVAAVEASTCGEESKNSLESYHRDSVPTQDRPHPTTFWIGLEQVIQHFESLYLNWNPGLFQYRQDIHFEWDVNTPFPGGCIVKHPQFALTSKGAGPVWLLLSRHFRDVPATTKEESDAFNDGSIRRDSQVSTNGDAPKGYMSIYICDGHGERLYMKDTYLESSAYVTTPQCLLRGDMDTSSAYTVVIDQDDLPPSTYTFSLSAFANTPITLEAASARFPLQKIEEGAWTRQTAGGGTDSPKYFDNPQYSLNVRQHGSLAILLTSTNHEHPLHVKLALGHGRRLHRLQSRDVLADSGNHRSGCVLAEIKDLQPGCYTVICSLFEAGLTGGYTLRVDSSSEVDLKQIPRDGAGLLSMKLAPACFGAHVHKVAAPLQPYRLASYTIIARFSKATSPRAMDLGKLARSPLRLSVELGRGPERKFIVASEQGEYADSATVRSESVNIDPKLSSQGDIWLVLDRLSGPGGPVEEWYDVEIYTDTPKACEIGVWREWDD
ncbi:cysteine proteinase [Stemphylium lycopersici]|uniref:Cysteine proteinase n=1 Tax=Stemphylium lycopersici TaxID=183478 RepID=A0A364MZC0_STELY|nr:cysteine proteinase [Stemphylium lycopersici]